MVSPCFTPSFSPFAIWVLGIPVLDTSIYLHLRSLQLHLVPVFKNVEAVANHRRDAIAAVFQVILSWLEHGNTCRCCRGAADDTQNCSTVWRRKIRQTSLLAVHFYEKKLHLDIVTIVYAMHGEYMHTVYQCTPLSLSVFLCPLSCAWLYRPGLCPGILVGIPI